MVNRMIRTVTITVSHLVNNLFHPLLMPFYLFLILLFYSSLMINNTLAVKMVIVKILFFITVLTPLISIGASSLITRLMGEKNSQTYNSILASVILAVTYLLSIYILKDYISLRMSLRFFIAPLIIILQFHLFRTFRVPFSVWCAALGGITTYLYLLSLHNIGGLVSILFSAIMICGMVGSARVYLGKDELKGVSVGYLMGIAATIISFYLPA